MERDRLTTLCRDHPRRPNTSLGPVGSRGSQRRLRHKEERVRVGVRMSTTGLGTLSVNDGSGGRVCRTFRRLTAVGVDDPSDPPPKSRTPTSFRFPWTRFGRILRGHTLLIMTHSVPPDTRPGYPSGGDRV